MRELCDCQNGIKRKGFSNHLYNLLWDYDKSCNFWWDNNKKSRWTAFISIRKKRLNYLITENNHDSAGVNQNN